MKLGTIAVILNWKRPQETINCLSSLGDGIIAVVVDNGSKDNSINIIHEAKPTINILVLEENLGFTGGNNFGIKWALSQPGCEWILLVNDDALLLDTTIDLMISAAQEDPRAGFIGPLIFHANSQNVIQSAGGITDTKWHFSHRGRNQADRGQYQDVEEVAWLSGCVLLVRSQMVREIGFLDERFFMYEEEVDWCLRGREAGWKSLLAPKARAYHAGGAAENLPKPYVTYFMTRNHFLLLSKHRAGPLPWLFTCLQSARTLASWTLRPKWRGMHDHRTALWRGGVDFLRGNWGNMPAKWG